MSIEYLDNHKQTTFFLSLNEIIISIKCMPRRPKREAGWPGKLRRLSNAGNLGTQSSGTWQLGIASPSFSGQVICPRLSVGRARPLSSLLVEDSNWEPDGVTLQVRLCEEPGTNRRMAEILRHRWETRRQQRTPTSAYPSARNRLTLRD